MGIIKTALIDKTLRLELEYREPACEAETTLEEPLDMGCVETGLAPSETRQAASLQSWFASEPGEQHLSAEFQCLLDVI